MGGPPLPTIFSPTNKNKDFVAYSEARLFYSTQKICFFPLSENHRVSVTLKIYRKFLFKKIFIFQEVIRKQSCVRMPRIPISAIHNLRNKRSQNYQGSNSEPRRSESLSYSIKFSAVFVRYVYKYTSITIIKDNFVSLIST